MSVNLEYNIGSSFLQQVFVFCSGFTLELAIAASRVNPHT